MNTFCKILLVSSVLAPSIVVADEDDVWINIHVASKHSGPGFYKSGEDTKTPYREKNVGIGIEYETGRTLSLKAGTYQNSLWKNSVYAGINVHSAYTNGFGVGVNIGGITGYSELTGMKISPIVLPGINYIHNSLRAELTYVPGIGQFDSVFGLTAGIKF